MFEYAFPIAGTQNLILIILTGFLIGLLSGFFGVGGGFLLVPILNIFYGIDIMIAKGTDLFQIFFTSIVGTYKHYKNRFVNFKIALAIGLPSVITVWIGEHLSLGIDKALFKILFGILLILISVKMFGLFNIKTPNTFFKIKNLIIILSLCFALLFIIPYYYTGSLDFARSLFLIFPTILSIVFIVYFFLVIKKKTKRRNSTI